MRGQCCISSWESNGPSSTVEVCKLEKSKEEVIVLVGVGSPEYRVSQKNVLTLRMTRKPLFMNME